MIQDSSTERQIELIKEVRSKDMVRDLIVVSSGGIRSGNEAIERIKAGADVVQIYTPLFIDGPKVVFEMLN